MPFFIPILIIPVDRSASLRNTLFEPDCVDDLGSRLAAFVPGGGERMIFAGMNGILQAEVNGVEVSMRARSFPCDGRAASNLAVHRIHGRRRRAVCWCKPHQRRNGYSALYDIHHRQHITPWPCDRCCPSRSTRDSHMRRYLISAYIELAVIVPSRFTPVFILIFIG